MIIDVHTHIFPSAIAERTLSLLARKGNIVPHSDGTASGLLQKMEQAHVDIAVTQPVLTSPAQFESVLKFCHELNLAQPKVGRRLISFAGIHPLCEDIDAKMKRIKEMGFLGVKIHPDYQGEFFSHEGYKKILECSNEYDLVVLTHAGVDRGFPDSPVRCTPEIAKDMILRTRPKKLVLAHLGGCGMMYGDTVKHLCGLDVYLDTAYSLCEVDRDTFMRILDSHGEDRILFASDSPWSDIKESIDTVISYGLCKSTEKKILCGNAAALLGITEV